MKRILFVIATLFAVSVTVSHAQTQTAPPSRTAAEGKPFAESQTSATQAAEVKSPRLAPKGIFYLMERVVVKNKSAGSVLGFAPGTRVKLIKDQGETLLVQSEDTEFEVRGDQLTNDLDLADLVARQDAQSQQALAQAMQERMERYRAEIEKKNQLSEQQLHELEKKYAAEPTPKPNYKSPLEREPYHEKSSNWPSWRPWIRH